VGALEELRMKDWEQIVADHGQTVWRTAYRLVSNEQDASDCMQETFISAMRFSRRQTVRNWRALLIRLATTRALDCLRSRKRETDRRVDGIEFGILAGRPESPTQSLECRELRDRLYDAIAQLPTQQAHVFTLRCLSDMAYKDIADQLGMERANVGPTLHRARAKLRVMLSEVMETPAG
jgi:RNA polymerase sigma-70 factor (ECF subfamily)